MKLISKDPPNNRKKKHPFCRGERRGGGGGMDTNEGVTIWLAKRDKCPRPAFPCPFHLLPYISSSMP